MEIIPDFSFFLWCCALRNSSSFLLVYLAPLWLSLSSFHPTMLFEGWKIYFSRKSHKKVSFFPFEMKKTSCISLGEEISSIYPSKVHSTFFYIYSLLANREWHLSQFSRHIKFIIFVVCELFFFWTLTPLMPSIVLLWVTNFEKKKNKFSLHIIN